jgi:hypothetical protein
MKWVVGVFLVVALGAFSLAVPASVVSTKAYASKMDGKPFGAQARTRRAPASTAPAESANSFWLRAASLAVGEQQI